MATLLAAMGHPDVLRRGKCSGVAAAAGWEGTTGGTRGHLRRVGLLRLNPGQPTVREVSVVW